MGLGRPSGLPCRLVLPGRTRGAAARLAANYSRRRYRTELALAEAARSRRPSRNRLFGVRPGPGQASRRETRPSAGLPRPDYGTSARA